MSNQKSLNYYEHWKKQAHNIFNSAYNDAINNYNKQKDNFLKQLNIEGEEESKKFIQKLNNQIDEEIESEIDKEFDQIFDFLGPFIEGFYAEAIETSNPSEAYNKLKKHFDSLINKGKKDQVNPKNLYKNLTNDIEKFFSSYNITRKEIGELVGLINSDLDIENTDIQNQLFGYCRKVILLKLQEKELKVNTQHYKQSLKGYYKETVITKALNKVLAEYNTIISAKGTGAQTNKKGQQIQYDILFVNNNNKMTEELFNFKIEDWINQDINVYETIMTEDTLIYGGIQSKSWIMPTSTKTHGGNRRWLSFGHHNDLIPQGEDAFYWHAGAYNVMNNLMDVVGKYNFIFSTGDNIYYTSQLLMELKQLSYVLAFSKPKDGPISSGDVGAMLHMDK